MKKLFRKINLSRKYFFLGLFILAVAVILLPQTANAAGTLETIGYTALNTGKAILSSPILLALGVISVLVMGVVGALNLMIIGFLVNIVQYNNFINEPSIRDAWIVVRDLCNMFFILVLLVIAFATILRQENYSVKKLLPKLLIMAVLINFSRTICGLIIDASQVIMMTFVNTFGSGGSFVDLTQMAKYFTGVTFSDFKSAQWSVLNVVIGLLIGIMFLIISGIVLVVAMSVFLMRIVMLWIYIVLSPLAFLAAAFPAGQKYATQWWSEFVKYIINGPVLAFFIWMALITSRQKITFFSGLPKQCFGNSDIMCMENFMPFVLSLGMLIGGLMITQQIGGVGSGMAGKGLDWAKKSGLLMGKGGLAYGGWMGRKFALFKGFQYGKPDEETGEKKRFLRGFEVRPTKIYAGVKEALSAKAQREEGDITAKSAAELREGRLVGAFGASRDFTEAAARGFLWNHAWRLDEQGVIFSTIKAGQANKEIKRLESEKSKAEADGKTDLEGLESEKSKAEAEFDAIPIEDTGRLTEKEEEVDKINKQIDEVRKEYVEKVGGYEKQIDEVRKANEKYKAPYTFYGDAKRMEIISEEGKKLGDNDNEEDLVEKFNDAIKQGNKNLASAVFLHAAKVGHSNEMLEQIKVLDNVKNSKGDIVSKFNKDKDKCDTFTADNAGLKGMVNQYFRQKLGMNEQEAFAIQNQFSVLAKKVNHYDVAESIGARNGLLFQRDDATQANRAVGEMMKRDIEQLLRQFNRLGHGGEIQYNYGGEPKRVSNFNQQAESAFFRTAASWHQEVIDRQRFNMNYAQNLYNTFKIEQEISGAKGKLPKNDALKAAITAPFKSILTSIMASGNAEKTYIDKSGEENPYKQLALETLKYGKTKYEGTTFAELNAKLAIAEAAGNTGEVERLKAERAKEEQIGKILGKIIDDQLNKIPGYKERLAKRKGGKGGKTREKKEDDYSD